VNKETGSDLRMTTQQYLKDYIRESRLKEGDSLPTEKELSERLGISRTAVREALKGLESLGVTKARQGKGHILRSFSYDAVLQSLDFYGKLDIQALKDLIEVRIALEPGCIAANAGTYTPRDIEELRVLLAQMEGFCPPPADEGRLVDARRRFHEKLCRRSANTLLKELINLFGALEHKLCEIHDLRLSQIPDLVRSHRSIIDALELGQPDLIRSACTLGFRGIYEQIIADMKS